MGTRKQKQLKSSTTVMPSGLTLQHNVARTYTLDGDENITYFSEMNTLNGKSSTSVQDVTAGTKTFTSPIGRVFTTTYDPATLLAQSVEAAGMLPVTFMYDDKGRITQSTMGTRTEHYTYTARGNLYSYTDASNKTTIYSYDLLDRLSGVTLPNGTTIDYAYDEMGRMTMLTTPNTTVHNFTYNGVGKRESYKSPLVKQTLYSYDTERKLTGITYPSGKNVSNVYMQGRLSQVVTPERTFDYTYQCMGYPGSVTAGTESIIYGYDGTLVTSVTMQGILNQNIAYTYNNDFAVTSSSYAGATTNYTYDNDGLLTGSGSAVLTRDPLNGFATQLSDGGYLQTRSYNGYGELEGNSDSVFGFNVTARYDNGQIKSKTENLNGTAVTFDYTYDLRGRLVEVKCDGIVTESYGYDANGNRILASTPRGTFSANYTVEDQLEQVGDTIYAYNEDGYLSSKIATDGTTHYNYGTLGELRSVTLEDGTLIEYLHNANNQRVAKKVNGVITEKYLWEDLTTLLAVYDGSDNLKIRFSYADARMPHKMSYEGATYYLSYDQVGSLRAVSDTAGSVVKEVTYDTFGNILSDTNAAMKLPFGFAGGLYDEDTQLTRFGYRDYDAYTGKWTAKDPIGFNGGDTNLYGYVLGDPVNFIDPEGLFWWTIAKEAIRWGMPAYTCYELAEDANSKQRPNCSNSHGEESLECIKKDNNWTTQDLNDIRNHANEAGQKILTKPLGGRPYGR